MVLEFMSLRILSVSIVSINVQFDETQDRSVKSRAKLLPNRISNTTQCTNA